MSIQSVHHRFCWFLSTGFGVGHLKKMPGTWGSLLACLFLLFIPINLIVLFCMSVIAVWVTHFYEESLGSHDSPQIVIDEVLGMFFCFLGIKVTLPLLFIGFMLFRFLDILKPGPIGWLDQKVPGALGTNADDVLAGIITCLILHSVIYFGVL